jgi:peptidoglycan/xylan/chitin deacetylase (PgdA/CDA1 family)
VFDVEDYTSPASEGLDDIPLWLAETMTEVGVKGTFFVIGEKARSLELRGRADVIAAMAQHDIGSHTNRGSIHPTVTEQLERAGWDDGIALMLQQEAEGIADLERIFGVPITALARHGGSYGPQLLTALGEMGRSYVYSPFSLPGHNATWFANTLNFYGEYGYFDDTYFRDSLFEPVFEEVKQRFPEDAAGIDVINFFGGHPSKVRSIQFWDFNYYHGANPDSSGWRTPELRFLQSAGRRVEENARGSRRTRNGRTARRDPRSLLTGRRIRRARPLDPGTPAQRQAADKSGPDQPTGTDADAAGGPGNRARVARSSLDACLGGRRIHRDRGQPPSLADG